MSPHDREVLNVVRLYTGCENGPTIGPVSQNHKGAFVLRAQGSGHSFPLAMNPYPAYSRMQK